MSQTNDVDGAGFSRRSFLIGASASLVALSTGARIAKGQSSTPTKTYAFINGQWFDGRNFRSRKFYSINGTLTAGKPARVDAVVDLDGKYVVPPYGEAHNHNLEWNGEEAFARTRRMYLEGGIFYVKNPNNLPRARTPLLGKINIPDSIDVTFANGGLTASGGHPIEIVQRGIERGGMTEADGDGGFYFIIDKPSDLESKWEKILDGKPDFLETYLLYSEEYLARRDDEKYYAWKGLNPALLPAIVKRAHRANLRVSTHIETAADFHNALLAGVDEINHTPGFRPENNDWTKFQDASRYTINDADARLAARNGTVVVTTLVSAIDHALPKKEAETVASNALRELLVHNLQILHARGVRLTIGSDSYRQTSVPEALNLHRLGVFDNRTLLKMWCEATAVTIFPKRKIGYLKDGYEASFLVLSGNPLEDFANVQKIERRFKQGDFLMLG